jgi:hypothetical protein
VDHSLFAGRHRTARGHMETVGGQQTAPTAASVTRQVIVRVPRESPQAPRAHGRRVAGVAPSDNFRWSAAFGPEKPWTEGERAVKPSAQPTLVRTQHLPPYFRRSKPVTPDGVTGFRVPKGAVPQTVGEALWASCGPDQIAGRCSDLVLIFTLSMTNDCCQGCCVGVCPFGVGVVRGPSAGRAGNPRTYSGRRPRPSRGRCNRWLSTDGHGPRPADGSRTRPICWLRRSSWPWMQWL